MAPTQVNSLVLVIGLLAVFPAAADAVDCNGNGVDDALDISAGTSLDCDGNGTPDECDDPLRPGSVHNLPLDTWYCAIQEAIGDAANGHEIVVAPGTYTENINFLGKAIHLHSEDPSDWSVIKTTVIDGNGLDQVVTFDSGEGNDSIIEGFKITRGHGTGGGVLCDGASPTIRSNDIYANWGVFGGGINALDSLVATPVIIVNNIIGSNEVAEADDSHMVAFGGGIACGGPAVIRNNLIMGNVVPSLTLAGSGGAISGVGSGVLPRVSS